MLAATLWLAGMVLIEILDYATNPDYGKDFQEPGAAGVQGAGAATGEAGAAAPQKSSTAKKSD